LPATEADFYATAEKRRSITLIAFYALSSSSLHHGGSKDGLANEDAY
jgi:hypothetical protein